MKANMKKLMVAVAAVGAMTSGSAMAASATDTATPFAVVNNLDLRIVIPAFLYFRVGTDSATVDRITFSPTAAVLGNSTPVAGTGGDAAAGSGANVAVRGNNGQVVIGTTVAAATGMGTGTAADGFINYNQITTTSSDAANFPAPTLANAGIPNTNVVLGGGPVGAGKVTVRTAVWTYAYANTTVPSAGQYDGRVTYTATMP
jgi:hypothetical protein